MRVGTLGRALTVFALLSIFSLLVGCPARWSIRLRNASAETIGFSVGSLRVEKLTPGQEGTIPLPPVSADECRDREIIVFSATGRELSRENVIKVFRSAGTASARYPYVYLVYSEKGVSLDPRLK